MWSACISATACSVCLTLVLVAQTLLEHNTWSYFANFSPLWVLLGLCCVVTLIPFFTAAYDMSDEKKSMRDVVREANRDGVAVVFSLIVLGLLITVFVLLAVRLDMQSVSWLLVMAFALAVAVIVVFYLAYVVVYNTWFMDPVDLDVEQRQVELFECCRGEKNQVFAAPICFVGFPTHSTGPWLNASLLVVYFGLLWLIVLGFLAINGNIAMLAFFVVLYVLAAITLVMIATGLLTVWFNTAHQKVLDVLQLVSLAVLVIGIVVSAAFIQAHVSSIHAIFSPLYIALTLVFLLGCIAAKHEHEFGYDRANPAQVFQDTYVENQGDEARSLMYPDGAPSATTPSEYPQDLSPRKLELFSGVTPQPTKMD